MTDAKAALVFAVALFVPSFATAGSEALSVGADRAFFQAISPEAFPKPVRPVFQRASLVSGIGESMDWFNAVLAEPGADPEGATTQVGDVDMEALLNRQLKSQLKYNLGGKDMWVSGAFDRQQNAYVSITVDGAEPLFFNVRGLLDKEENVSVGTAKYKLYLNPNVINQMKSEIILENAADEDDKVRVTLKKMLDAVGSTGAPVTVSKQAYRIFYTDDVKNGRIDKTAKTFTFMHVSADGQIHVFLIPAEYVATDKITVFKMYANVRVGLMQKAGQLKVYENP